MDFDGPVPFVVGDQGGTISIFGDALTIPITTHHRLPNTTYHEKMQTLAFRAQQHQSDDCGHVPNIFSNKYWFALKTTLL